MKTERHQNHLLSEILAECSDAVLMIDDDFEILFFNEAFEHLLQYDKGELKGKRLQNIIREKFPVDLKDDVGAPKNGGPNEITAIQKDGNAIRLKIKSKKIDFADLNGTLYFFENKSRANEEFEDL